MFHRIDTPHILFIHLPFAGHLGYFHFLVLSSAALSICVQVSVWTCVSISLGYANSVSVFEEARLFFEAATPFTFPLAERESSSCPAISLALGGVHF